MRTLTNDHANAIDAKLEEYTKEEKKAFFGGQTTIYKEGDQIQKIESSNPGEITSTKSEYFFLNGNLHYAINTTTDKTGDDSEHFFFDENQKMTKWIKFGGKEKVPGDKGFENMEKNVVSGLQMLIK